MNFPLQAPSWLRHHSVAIIALGIFAVSFIFLLWLQADPTFADPDSFYHAKMAMVLRDEGIIQTFPWLQFTFLRDAYTDQHFLYHIFLIPFVTILPPIVGTKLVTILLASSVVLLVYLFLNSLKVPWAWAFAMLLLLVTPLTFRLSLAKAPSVSLLFLIGGIWLLIRKKYLWLGVLSFLYVWSYGGFLLLLFSAGVWVSIGFLQDILALRRIARREYLFTFGTVFIGTTLGVIVNPFFPQNIAFFWNQLVKIGIVNYQGVLGVGNEWYPYKFIDLVSNTIFLSIIVLIGVVVFVVLLKRQSKVSWLFLILALFFFLLTLKSKRYVEYYVPFGMLFGATAIGQAASQLEMRQLARDMYRWVTRKKVLGIVVALYFIVTLPGLAVRDVRTTKRDLGGGSNVLRFAQASHWLATNTPEGSVVFHSSWDEFPILFYHNTHNYYIIGLDPTFMYEYDRRLYALMVDITTGKEVENPGSVLRDEFGASYAFVEKNHDGMKRIIESISGVELVYSDNEAFIYDIRTQ